MCRGASPSSSRRSEIYKEVRGPVILPAQQKVTWRTIQMYGTAETVIVPLEQLAAS